MTYFDCGHVTYLQRISGDERDVDDARLIRFHCVDERVLPLDASLSDHRVATVQMEPQLDGQRRQAPYTSTSVS